MQLLAFCFSVKQSLVKAGSQTALWKSNEPNDSVFFSPFLFHSILHNFIVIIKIPTKVQLYIQIQLYAVPLLCLLLKWVSFKLLISKHTNRKLRVNTYYSGSSSDIWCFIHAWLSFFIKHFMGTNKWEEYDEIPSLWVDSDKLTFVTLKRDFLRKPKNYLWDEFLELQRDWTSERLLWLAGSRK